jgi:hypothetical protein
MKKSIAIIILILIVALPYLPTLKYGFLFDDYHLVIRNENLSSLNDLKHYFIETHHWQKGHANYYRPMMYSSLMLNHLISGKNAWSYHLFNIIINLLVSLLVFFIAKNIFKTIGSTNYYKIAALAAALFAVHPLHTEVVTNIAGRADSMMTFWILLGVLLSVKAYKGNLIAGFFIGFCALAAGLTKETGFLIMPVILLYYFLFCKNSKLNSAGKMTAWISGSLGTLISVAMYISAMHAAQKINGVSYLDNFCAYIPLDQRIKTAVYLFGRSIKLFFIPFPLSADYSFAEITPQLSFLNIYSAVAIIIISGGLLWSWKKTASSSRKITEFAVLWFIICYIFSSNLFFPIGTIFGERLLYLASVGFCIAIAWWIFRIKIRWLRIICTSFIISIYICITVIRNFDWDNPDDFYNAMIRTAPKSAKAHLAAARRSVDNNNFTLAAKQLNNSLAIFPAFAEAHSFLSSVFWHEQNYSNAFLEANRAINLTPNVPSAHYVLYRIYLKRGEKEKAEKHYKLAKELAE